MSMRRAIRAHRAGDGAARAGHRRHARARSDRKNAARDLRRRRRSSRSAYDNTALPIACGQTISQPYRRRLHDRGARSAAETCACWRSAPARAIRRRCSRRCAACVYTVERHTPAAERGRRRASRTLKLHNVVTRHGDGFKGWPRTGAFRPHYAVRGGRRSSRNPYRTVKTGRNSGRAGRLAEIGLAGGKLFSTI